jgi:hypothetical protein
MFCSPGHVFGGAECIGLRFHVLHVRTSFRRYRGCWVPFSCFVLPDSFSAVQRVPCPVFMFSAPLVVFSYTEGIGSRFHVLHSRARFRRYGWRRVSISCFALPDSFWAVPRASSLIFIFCAPELVFGCTEGVRSRFHVLCALTRFRQYRGRQILFSCFALPESFSAVPSASGPIFMFYVPELVLGGTEGV